MPDPFLSTHQVAEFVFDIGGKLAPISIRDQMVRGQSIVDRALAAGFKTQSKDLLVIGAGAAGACAAIRAAAEGIVTHLIEAEKSPFLRQAACSTRWIHPHEYEWPVDHWSGIEYPYDETHFPYFGPPTPLAWAAGWASNLAVRWQADLTEALTPRTPLHFRPNTRLAAPPAAPVYDAVRQEWTVPLSDGTSVTVGMIILAVGFGAERCEVPPNRPGGPPPTFRSLAFWETDRLRHPNCGLRPAKLAQVVISGGGDGALQDFLRVVTRSSSVRDIYRRSKIPADIERPVLSAELRAQRSFLWDATGDHDHDAHRTLHEAHRHAVQRALSPGSPVSAALQSLLPRLPPDVTLVHPCTHFAQVYALNRFLVLLITEFYARAFPEVLTRPRLIPNASVSNVAGLGTHVCNVTAPRRCHGRRHEVTLVSYGHVNCLALAPIPGPPPTLRANLAVIRHGLVGPALGMTVPALLAPSSPWPTLAAIGHHRHVLPLHCSR
jgi:hypothetical protein